MFLLIKGQTTLEVVENFSFSKGAHATFQGYITLDDSIISSHSHVDYRGINLLLLLILFIVVNIGRRHISIRIRPCH